MCIRDSHYPLRAEGQQLINQEGYRQAIPTPTELQLVPSPSEMDPWRREPAGKKFAVNERGGHKLSARFGGGGPRRSDSLWAPQLLQESSLPTQPPAQLCAPEHTG
eukprot:13014196-Alexandrium_andersonii.AAC.1